ncbi:MAG TPA: hypothetical protein VJ910_09445 [Desulfuromonadales bacterium]|nr:hypothetical protein [Desulfuromonadales bacterium]
MGIMWLLGGNQSQKRRVIEKSDQESGQVIAECYCQGGHSILSNEAEFDGHPGLTLKLKNSRQEGLLSISPIIGDCRRQFIDFERIPGEVVEICCPVCAEPFPLYNECSCGAHLIALFTSPRAQFSRCVGICQRIGCLHSELISERDLRLLNRQDYF